MSQILTGRVDETKTTARKLESKRRDATRKMLSRIPVWVLIGLLLVIVLYPLLWMLLSSLKTNAEFSLAPFWGLPSSFNWQNYAVAWTSGMSTYCLNSVIVVFPSLALILLISTAASFALEVLLWRGRHGILLIFLAGIMVRLQMVLLPLFTI